MQQHQNLQQEYWQGNYGDRRQEIVFIGQNLVPENTCQTLDSCLLSDAEMALGEEAWRRFVDPFPEWFASDDEG